MLYRIVRPFATAALKINFRKIYFSNAQVIPKNKPVILAVNHPTAFMEPCLLACLLSKPLHFIVRGDLFTSSLIRKIFDSLHLIPIYRIQDAGFSGLKNNYQTFEKCFETLKQNKTLLILAEGNTIQEKRLRTIQKGTARIALGALEKYSDLDLQIVPVGVNYTYADQFRSRVMFEFGQPIAVQEYAQMYREEANKAFFQLTKALKNGLEKHVVIIQNKADDELVEKLLAINRNDFPDFARPVVSLNNHLLKREKAMADAINQMTDEHKISLDKEVAAYLIKLEKYGLEDWAVAQQHANSNTGWRTIILGMIPFVIGYAGNYIPAWIANYIATTKVHYLEFVASVRVAVAIGTYLIYYLLLLIIAMVLKNLFLVVFVLLLPFLGYYAILYKEYFQKWKWLKTLRKVKPSTRSELFKERQNLLNQFLN